MCEYTGERSSLVAYSKAAVADLDQEVRAELASMGFPVGEAADALSQTMSCADECCLVPGEIGRIVGEVQLHAMCSANMLEVELPICSAS